MINAIDRNHGNIIVESVPWPSPFLAGPDRLRRDRHEIANQMRHGKIQTAENSYGHLFAQDREPILRGP